MIHIGFTGTREGMTDYQLAMLEGLLATAKGVAFFHHGTCRGADCQAAVLVRKLFGRRVHIVGHPGPILIDNHSGVDDETRPSVAFLTRNRHIVDESNELYACPKEAKEVQNSGTWATIRYARKKGKPVTIIFPDGSLG